jgi:hypothetical protein
MSVIACACMYPLKNYSLFPSSSEETNRTAIFQEVIRLEQTLQTDRIDLHDGTKITIYTGLIKHARELYVVFTSMQEEKICLVCDTAAFILDHNSTSLKPICEVGEALLRSLDVRSCIDEMGFKFLPAHRQS